MKKYDVITETPLTFHYIMRFLIIPLAFCEVISRLSEYYVYSYELYPIDFYTISILIVDSICLVAAFIGFFKWKMYAWYSIIIYYFIYFLSVIINVVLTLAICPDEILGTVPSIVISLPISTCIIIYYLKRKGLFLFHAPSYKKAKIRYCRKCGARLTEGSKFCSKCGTIIEED